MSVLSKKIFLSIAKDKMSRIPTEKGIWQFTKALKRCLLSMIVYTTREGDASELFLMIVLQRNKHFNPLSFQGFKLQCVK